MSHPGSFPGDPAWQQPGPQPAPPPGVFEYPADTGGTAPPPPYSMPPPGYSPPQPMPPGAFPPPPPYYPYAHPQYPPQYPAPYGPPAPTNGLAIGSLVSSLVGIPGYVLCFGFVGSIVGIVLGIVALNQIGKSGQKGKGMAIAGIVLGTIGLVGMGLVSVLVASPSLWN